MRKPKIGVFKFTSCDGCQLAILNLDEGLLDLISFFDISYFKEAIDSSIVREFDIAIIEGSITTNWQKKDIVKIREVSRYLIAIGACATAGGLQALRNWDSIIDFKRYVYPTPEIVDVLSTSTPISEHVYTDYELWGCPIDKNSFVEVLTAFLLNKRPRIPRYSLCMECKSRGIPCIIVSNAEPCLGPVTVAGCGAICPSVGRPCYGCFGPREDANINSLISRFQSIGINRKVCQQLLDKMNTYAFRKLIVEQL